MTIVTLTLLIQACSLVAAALPRLLHRPLNSALGFVVVVFASVYWFPPRWSGMELITVAYFLGFLTLEVLAYLLVWAVVVLVRQLRESASSG